VDGENEDVAHGANRTMIANVRKTATHRRIPSYCEFATHTHWLLSLTDAQRNIEAWRQYLNEARVPILRWDGPRPPNSPASTGLAPRWWATKSRKSPPESGSERGQGQS
jgi:hypothetical protein